MKKLFILTLFFFSVCHAQIVRDISVYRGDSTRIEFKANGNITAKGIIFVVKLTKAFSAPRLIQKKNNIAGGSSAEIVATYSAPQTKVTVILGPEDTQDLTGTIYYYDIIATDGSTLTSYLTFNYGNFKIIQDVQTPFDGTNLPGSGVRVGTIAIENATSLNSVIVWDTTNNYWEPISFDDFENLLNISTSTAGNADSLGSIPAVSYALKSDTVSLSNRINTKFNTTDTSVFISDALADAKYLNKDDSTLYATQYDLSQVEAGVPTLPDSIIYTSEIANKLNTTDTTAQRTFSNLKYPTKTAIADSNFVLTSETSAWDTTASDDLLKVDSTLYFTQTDALSKANTTLSNLGTTSINTSLLPQYAGFYDLGSTDYTWGYNFSYNWRRYNLGKTASTTITILDPSTTQSIYVPDDGGIFALTPYPNAIVANTLAYWSTRTKIGHLSTSVYPNLTEISYVKGVTSGIQSQLDAKPDVSDVTSMIDVAIQEPMDSISILQDRITALEQLVYQLILDPLAPDTLEVRGSVGEIDVFWTENGNRDSTIIYRSTDNITFTRIAAVDSPAITYKDSGLVANVTYYYKLRNKLNTPVVLESSFSSTMSSSYSSYLLRRIDVEENNKTDWETVTGTASLLSIPSSAAANSTRYGSKITFDGTNTIAYSSTTVSSALNKLDGGFYIYVPSTLDSATAYSEKAIFAVNHSGGTKFKISLLCNASGLPYRWNTTFVDGDGTDATASAVNFSLDAWHYITFDYYESTTSGYGHVWIDGDLAASDTLRNTLNAQEVSTVKFGIYSNSTVYTNGNYFYLDEFTLNGNIASIITAGSGWFVGLTSTGTGLGDSRANQTGISSIDAAWWSNVSNGDSVFLSGGADSVVYNDVLDVEASGTVGNSIVITKDWRTDHDGKVIFDGGGTLTTLIELNDIAYVKVIDITVQNGAASYSSSSPQGYIGSRDIMIARSNNIEIDSCIVRHDYNLGIQLEYADNCIIGYNNIYTGVVDSLTETDGIYLQYGCDNNIIENNTILQRNSSYGGYLYSHKDGIQISGSTPYNVGGIIRNNLIVSDVDKSTGSGIFLRGIEGDWAVYNNIIAGEFGAAASLLSLRSETTSNSFEARVYNNTLATISDSAYMIEVRNADSAFVYNNLLYEPSGNLNLMFLTTTSIKSDYNRFYYDPTFLSNDRAVRVDASYYSFAGWQAAGTNDDNSTNGAFSFVDYGGKDVEDYATTGDWTGFNLGTAISTVTTDILGTARPEFTTYDIGAIESTTDLTVNAYYVNVAGSGAEDGSSWANAKSFEDLRGAWNTIPAGTTVYIDGGADSTFYSINGASGINGYEFNPQGTVGAPITVTKGIDSGHDGKVIFRKNTITGGIIGLEVSGANNTIIDNIDFQGKVSTISSTYLVFFYDAGSPENLTFQYCTFRMFYSEGVGTNGSTEASNNIKFLHCDFLNLIDTGTNSAMDMMWLGGANHTNWEIAYCNFINANPKTGATVASAHRDLIQCEAGWGQGGTFKIHHNFFDDRSAGSAGACIESEHLRGNWEIYNNVFKSNATNLNNTGFFSLLSLTGEGNTYANSMKVYNNTFYATTDQVRMMSFNGWDALDFRNNIVYSVPSDWWCVTTDGWTQSHSLTFDYNQYNNTGSIFMYGETVIGSGEENYTFAQWQTAGFDLQSSYNDDTPTFVDANGTDGTDYALQAGSDGIDRGTADVSATVTDDYSGTARPVGAAYDVGAFER